MTTIAKSAEDWKVPPNYADYAKTREGFSWSAVDRHAEGPLASRTALRFITDTLAGGELVTHDLSFAELGRRARRFTTPTAIRILIRRGRKSLPGKAFRACDSSPASVSH